MIGFGLLCGHMVGDYIFQTDWMASRKSAVHPGPRPTKDDCLDALVPAACLAVKIDLWNEKLSGYRQANLACTVHCLLYTLAVWLFSFWWMPWWGLVVCFAAHWPIDRFRLAGRWMRNVSGQSNFAKLAVEYFPIGVVLVDNTFHLVTLFLIAALAL